MVKIPHQCVHCSKLYEDAAPELLQGCTCGSKFFFYIRKEKYEQLNEYVSIPIEFKAQDKKKVEKDVREIMGIEEEEPVILDLESVRIIKPGKFEIDLVNLFKKDRPIVFKLEEGKYIIDLGNLLKKQEK